MDRKKLGALLVAFVIGAVLSASSVSADLFGGVKGYILGDPAHGKLVPFYRVGGTTGNLATLIGIEAEQHRKLLREIAPGIIEDIEYGDVQVHVAIWSKRSRELQNFELCLSPFDFGFIVLQNGPVKPEQSTELLGPLNRFHKARVLSLADLGGNTEGYVTIATVGEFFSEDGTCKGSIPIVIQDIDVHLATWAILADVGTGFFATEIPTPTAVVNEDTGRVSGLRVVPGIGVVEASLGLIPGPTPIKGFEGTPGHPLLHNDSNPVWGGNHVFARFDVNPAVDSHTEIYVWLKRNAFPAATELDVNTLQRSPSVPGILWCEDELGISTTVDLLDEVNVINPNDFPGIGQCKFLHQYRGVLLFQLPDTGFLWSHITQVTSSFRQNYIGYNLDNNGFVDCADDENDFDESADGLCPRDDRVE
ncbi:MAG TPA: hypothetical protein VGX03_12310 [Candidatus Binatia bacterium]|jgi:hypothetical protein|nr:hypothetical protein [Candidatus Binatia bacterium]